LLKAVQARQATSIDTVLKHLQQLRGGDGNPPAPAPASASAPRSSAAARPSAPQVKSAETSPRESAPAPAPTLIPASAPVAPIAAAPPVPAMTAARLSPTPMSGETNLEELWRSVLDAVGRASQFARSHL